VSEFSFNNLNLSEVEFSGGSSILDPGRHVVKVDSAELKDTRTGGKQIAVSFSSTEGKGGIRAWINVHVPSSPTATKIGREQLKALLVNGGHANPDHPGDVASLVGLIVGVGVAEDRYIKDGEERVGSKVSYYFDPKTASKPAPQAESGGAPKPAADDEIPF